jgi:rhodanese-related sulfurtransferase
MEYLTPQQAKMLVDAQEVVVLDVTDPENFEAKHIPRAINIPVGELERRANKELQKNDRILVYGAANHSSQAEEAARKLGRLGFDNVMLLQGGAQAWQDKQFNFEGQAA